MTSQSLEIVRHVLWTSVTGGWLYDPQHHPFVNITQLYFWLLLFVCPLLVFVFCAENTTVWALYCLGVFLVFAISKLVNYQLHKMFDTSERINDGDTAHGAKTQLSVNGDSPDLIEMSILATSDRHRSTGAANSVTQPECVSHLSEQTQLSAVTAFVSSGGAAGSVDSNSVSAEKIDHEADVHRSAATLGPHEYHVAVSNGAAAALSSNSASERQVASDPSHHIDLISELPEEEVIEENDSVNVAAVFTDAQRVTTELSTVSANTYIPPTVYNNSSDTVAGADSISAPTVFDLPSFLNAVRERVQGTLSPITFRRTLSVSDARESIRSRIQRSNAGRGTAEAAAGGLVHFDTGRSLTELPAVRELAGGRYRSIRSGSLTAEVHGPHSAATLSSEQRFTSTNHSGSEDDAKDSDSPLLDGGNGRIVAGDDVSAINVWVKDASEAPSLCNTSSLHSLVGVGRLFGDGDGGSIVSDGASAQSCTGDAGAATPAVLRDDSCSHLRSRHNRRPRAGSSASVSSMPSRWSSTSGHRRRAIRIHDNQRISTAASATRSPRSSSPHSSHCRRRHHAISHAAILPPLPTSSSSSAAVVNTASHRRIPPSQLLHMSAGAHLAESHEDTSSGAVHYFQDEFGNWMTYTFNNAGFSGSVPAADSQWSLGSAAAAVVTLPSDMAVSGASSVCKSSSSPTSYTAPAICSSGYMRSASGAVAPVSAGRSASVNDENALGDHLPAPSSSGHINSSLMLGHSGSLADNTCEAGQPASVGAAVMASSSVSKDKHSHHYRMNVWGSRVWLKVRFERLTLLSLMDRSVLPLENFVAVILALLTALLASAVLHDGMFRDLGVVFLIFTLASSQYCLMKSVQPDAASPTHGHNRLVVFSRAVYFCLLCALTLAFKRCRQLYGSQQVHIYGLVTSVGEICSRAGSVTQTMLLLLPLLFAIGLLPQVNTFAHYLLEQIDHHAFGGTAGTGLPAAAYGLLRSVLAVLALYGLAYGGLRENGGSETAQHILFSIYCGVSVAVAYHLSRCSCDPGQLWCLVRQYACADLKPIVVSGVSAATTNTAGDNVSVPATTGTTSTAAVDVDKHSVNCSVSGTLGGGGHDDMGTCRTGDEPCDPLPSLLLQTVHTRLKSDALACTIAAVMFFAVHCSTVFSSLRPVVGHVLCAITVCVGMVLHYILPQLRQQLPWLCLSRPILVSAEYHQYDVHGPAQVMWFERALVWCVYIERHVLYPLVFLSALTIDPPQLVHKLGLEWTTLVVVVCTLKNLRSTYTDPSCSYLVLLFTVLLFEYDLFGISETFLVDYFVVAIVYDKVTDLLLKLQFVTTYIAPWQITWGSAFHAFAQPFSVPHSAILLAQAALSALLSSPLNPFLGSAVFIASYVRPIKFWERNYNTRRVDHSNTRLSHHLERNPGANDNNLNSIFYEHLTRSLQKSLCGDVLLGRWGEVRQGDCFVLASDYLNCLVHIIELGNGLLTFQVRGLEFLGTYCQQREVEAISEGVEEDAGCCCCEPGHLPHFLSVNQIFNQRWLAWQVLASKYVLEGYSITDNSASSMLQMFDLRKVLVCYYVKSIIYYAVRSSSLQKWLSSSEIMSNIVENTTDPNFVDVDPIFNMNIDEDYDFRASGVTRQSFCNVYYDWIKYCVQRRSDHRPECNSDSPVVLLCLSLSLLGRRALCVASHHSHSSVEFFLYGLHALFKGDFRITSLRDEWVFSDMDLLKKVVAPAIRMSLKLHQDHFMSPEDYDLPQCLYDAIQHHEEHLVIAHEGDPAWRNAILSGAPSLLALRHMIDDSSDHYKVIMLNKRHLSFRLIKLNRECVRGLWSGQQQELIYLRNRNPERGSIQNARQVLRNIINSSCDQPIGYPIYVSPLTTSYAETSVQLVSVLGRAISFDWVRRQLLMAWQRLRVRCGESCASSGSMRHNDTVHYSVHSCAVHLSSTSGQCVRLTGTFPIQSTPTSNTSTAGPGVLFKPSSRSLPPVLTCGCPVRAQSAVRRSTASAVVPCTSEAVLQAIRNSAPDTLVPTLSSLLVSSNSSSYPTGGPTTRTITSLHGSLTTPSPSPSSALQLQTQSPPTVLPSAGFMPGARVLVARGELVYDTMNLGRRSDVVWPDECWRRCGGKDSWGHWLPDGRYGTIVHFWSPVHPQLVHRSHIDKVILLVEIEGRYVPVAENGCLLAPEDNRDPLTSTDSADCSELPHVRSSVHLSCVCESLSDAVSISSTRPSVVCSARQTHCLSPDTDSNQSHTDQ